MGVCVWLEIPCFHVVTYVIINGIIINFSELIDIVLKHDLVQYTLHHRHQHALVSVEWCVGGGGGCVWGWGWGFTQHKVMDTKIVSKSFLI